MDFFTLPSRKILQISGAACQDFLQGLVTCDVRKLSDDTALYGLFLTPQGRIKSPFFLFKQKDLFFLDLPSEKSGAVLKYLQRMALRHPLDFSFSNSQSFACASRENAPENPQIILPDPRFSKLGYRGIFENKENGNKVDSDAAYAAYLAGYGLADDRFILEHAEELYPSEVNLDLLHSISWEKGCFTGQEVTARFYHRSLTKKRLLPLRPLHKTDPEALKGLQIYNKEKEEAGKIAITESGHILAFIDKKYWQETDFFSKEMSFQLLKPEFFPF